MAQRSSYAKTLPFFVLSWATLILAGCATTHDLPEKYANYIGKQFRTRSDCYIWERPRHEYEFSPYSLEHVKSDLGQGRRDFIPAGTVVTIKGAKRSYKGGDWDYLLAEVRAPQTGTLYEFEVLLGFSNYFPGDIEKILIPIDQSSRVAGQFESEDHFNAANGRFSIRRSVFVVSPETISTAGA